MPPPSLAERVCRGLAGFLQHAHAVEMHPALKEHVVQAELFRLVQAHFPDADISVNVRPKRWEDRSGGEAVDIAVPEHREWKAFLELKWLHTAAADQARLDMLQDVARLASCTRSASGQCERLLVACLSQSAWAALPITSNTSMRPIFDTLLVSTNGAQSGSVTYQQLQNAHREWQDRTPHGVKVGLNSGLRTDVAAECPYADSSGGEGRVVVWRVERLRA